IKDKIPKPILKTMIFLREQCYVNPKKRKLFSNMQKKHKQLLQNIHSKEKIKVVFLVIHHSIWKVDPVFQSMLADPKFEPIILVCPYIIYGENRMWVDMKATYNYFKEKKYPLLSSYITEEERWINLNELNPDILFFTNPHKLTRSEYYEDAYLSYLSCYVPYSHNISKYNGYNSQYNQDFHNAMWLIFAPHDDDLEIFHQFSQRKKVNVFATGYPACEALLSAQEKTVWKHQECKKLKIIWAPHHTIDTPELPYSNFIELASFFKEIAIKYKDNLQFAFKPHPILKEKLYNHKDWGKDKTNSYYNYWDEQSNTQLELGDYIELFKNSDAMIHDSGSFLAEYHYVRKPVFYICDESVKNYLNPFGIKALSSCFQGKNCADIES
ncbi:CDP-glycerol glycerophosphotransferase family protein, partial [Providencia rettgeri]|uniref:CDP-glycerol glycerophosphotransferase family protein n=1 Tax=Providencia rettgeri TaxID=587 RepID=UPI001B362849